MTRLEYIKEIEKLIKNKLPDSDRYDIMRDYAEFFEEGKKQGKTEEEVMRSLGDPADIVKEILSNEEDELDDDPLSLGKTAKEAKIIGRSILGGTKKVASTVMDSTQKTVGNIAESVKTAIPKQEKKEKIPKEKKEKPPKVEKVKPPKAEKIKREKVPHPMLDFIVSIPGKIFFSFLGLIILTISLAIILLVFAMISIVSVFSVFLSSVSITVLLIFCISVLFFGVGALLSAFLIFSKCKSKKSMVSYRQVYSYNEPPLNRYNTAPPSYSDTAPPKPIDLEQPNNIETEQAKPLDMEQPSPVEREQANNIEIEQSNHIETDQPNPSDETKPQLVLFPISPDINQAVRSQSPPDHIEIEQPCHDEEISPLEIPVISLDKNQEEEGDEINA